MSSSQGRPFPVLRSRQVDRPPKKQNPSNRKPPAPPIRVEHDDDLESAKREVVETFGKLAERVAVGAMIQQDWTLNHPEMFEDEDQWSEILILNQHAIQEGTKKAMEARSLLSGRNKRKLLSSWKRR